MNEMAGNIIRLEKGNIGAAAVTLAKAFKDYPVTVYFTPDGKKRARNQTGIYTNILKSNLKEGEVYITSPKAEGVAVWLPMDKKQPVKHPVNMLKWLGSLFSSREMRKRLQGFMSYSQQLRDRFMPERYWYLQMLGVNPACQGQGFSSRLLKPMLERADREGLPVFLETQLKKNVTLYEHFGFKVVEEGKITGGDLYSWAMVRKHEK